jgi:hypothetical protein
VEYLLFRNTVPPVLIIFIICCVGFIKINV